MQSFVPGSVEQSHRNERLTALSELRSEFGDNWSRFLESIDEVRICLAEESLRGLIGQVRLDGLTFLDVGSGSGLSSLAARRLGATVSSRTRGMSPWRDVVDWVGGYPFEVARPEQVFDFYVRASGRSVEA